MNLFGRKKGIQPNSNWRTLEKKHAKSLAKRNPKYKTTTQKVYKGYGKRPDIYGQHKTVPHKRIGGESKCVKTLTSNNVKQARSYKKHPGYISKMEIGICRDTKVSRKVRKQAKASNISIKRFDVSRTKSWYRNI
jgi:hypothetical protein|tara:strand:+ start:114 stop:518 length:405 start_codon:yes stop_codon:yes gene_type:complete